MKSTVFVAVMVAGIAYALGVAVFHESCNEDKCVSVVSKCQLTGACGCTLENCTCCMNCTLCLAELYDECCACVSLCKPRNTTGAGSDTDYASFSTVGEVQSQPSLFEALTQMGKPMPDAHWVPYRVTPEQEGVNLANVLGNSSTDRSPEIASTAKSPSAAESGVNTTTSCPVAYINRCLPMRKCVDACHHMGASKYRWFHTACCECIGQTCLSYGRNEALCSECPND